MTITWQYLRLDWVQYCRGKMLVLREVDVMTELECGW